MDLYKHSAFRRYFRLHERSTAPLKKEIVGIVCGAASVQETSASTGSITTGKQLSRADVLKGLRNPRSKVKTDHYINSLMEREVAKKNGN